MYPKPFFNVTETLKSDSTEIHCEQKTPYSIAKIYAASRAAPSIMKHNLLSLREVFTMKTSIKSFNTIVTANVLTLPQQNAASPAKEKPIDRAIKKEIADLAARRRLIALSREAAEYTGGSFAGN